jgi:hypothetical protein
MFESTSVITKSRPHIRTNKFQKKKTGNQIRNLNIPPSPIQAANNTPSVNCGRCGGRNHTAENCKLDWSIAEGKRPPQENNPVSHRLDTGHSIELLRRGKLQISSHGQTQFWRVLEQKSKVPWFQKTLTRFSEDLDHLSWKLSFERWLMRQRLCHVLEGFK